MGDGTILPEVNEAFQGAARAGGYYTDELMEALTAGALLAERAEVPEADRGQFATAHEIDPDSHVRMQAAFQAHTDLAVSKTVNLPREAGVDVVQRVYRLAYELGCKGVTVYRDGSRAVQVLAHAAQAEATTAIEPRRRHLADERQSLTHKFRVGDQEGYITVGLYEDGTPGEVFIKIAKEGSTVSGLTDAVALLTSIALQYGVSLDKLADKLEQTRFEPYGITANPDIPFATSLLDYVFRWLRLHFGTPHEAALAAAGATSGALSGLTCPDCGMQLEFAERCLICRSCGYSKCG
jgi:ribonucleoside-diphosphate reductase alpha chain